MAGRGVIEEEGANPWNGIERMTRLRAAETEMPLKSTARNATTQAAMIDTATNIFSNPGAIVRAKGDLRASRSRIAERVDLGIGGGS